MRIIFAVLVSCCKSQKIESGNSAAPRCYRCYQYAMKRGQDFIKSEKNDDGCDKLISATEIVEPRMQQVVGNYRAQTVCLYAHSTGTMRLVKQKWVFSMQNTFEFRIFESGQNQTMFVEKNVEKYYRGYLQLLGEGNSVFQKMPLEIETTLTSFGSIGNSTVRVQIVVDYRLLTEF